MLQLQTFVVFIFELELRLILFVRFSIKYFIFLNTLITFFPIAVRPCRERRRGVEESNSAIP